MQNPLSNLGTQAHLADMIERMHRWSFLSLSKSLAKSGASFTQFCLLGLLDGDMPSPTMSEIAARMKHTCAAATGLVERLVQLDYVKRANDAADRRRILIHITQKGKNLLRSIRNERANYVERFMQVLDDSEKRDWLRIYEKIIDAKISYIGSAKRTPGKPSKAIKG